MDPSPPARPGDRAPPGEGSAPTPAPPAPPAERRSFLRALLAAARDRRTYDPRGNPALWLGAFLAFPIPVLAHVAQAPLWLELATVITPLGWAVLLGAAGRLAADEKAEVVRLESEARVAQKTAAAEREIRDQLEREKRLITAELKLAHAIHRTLLPSDIVRPEVQVVVRQIPSSYVGGDYLDAWMPRPDILYLCVGDVSGHGVAAALVVSRLHGVVRRLVFEQRTPEQFLEELNRRAIDILKHTYFFMTFAVFRVDLSARRIDFATAGHPAQALVRADGTVEPLSTPNRLLGMDADVFDPERPVDSVRFEPGDSLVLFTDGLFEIPGKGDGEILGEEGLQEVLRNMGGLPPALVVGDILQDLADFQGDSKFQDDVSLMVARFEPSSVPAAAGGAASTLASAAPAGGSSP